MKTCVSTYSYGWQNHESQLGEIGVVEKAAEAGFEGIEFVERKFTTMEKAHLLREKCEEKGIVPVAFCVGADFAIEDEIKLKDEIERVKGLVDVAEKLGVSMLRHDVAYGAFKRKHNIGYDDMLPYIAKAALEVTKYAEQKGIRTMTENHGFFSQDALRVEKLINTVGHSNFGALIDIGNFMCVDEDPCHSVGILAPYAFHVHCKDFFFKSGKEINPGDGWMITRSGNYLRATAIGHGDAGAYQSIRSLIRSGYDGYFTVEFEGVEDVYWGIDKGLANLKRFIEMAKGE